MALDDFGDEFEMHPVDEDGDFFSGEICDMLISFPSEEVEKVTCYYKLRKIFPSETYASRCQACDGFPIKDRCIQYVTQDHIKGFPERMNENDTKF